MLRMAALVGAMGSLALASPSPTAAQSSQLYEVQFSRVLAVVPSEGDLMGVKSAIAGAFPFPVVGYVNDQMGNAVALTSEQVTAQLRTYKAKADADGKPMRLDEFVKIAHLSEPKSLTQELKERGMNMLRGDIITNVVYGGKRPPDNWYMTYDGPKSRTYCSMPLLNCGDKYYSMSAGTLKNLMREPESKGETNRRLTYYLWDANPWPVPDKQLGKFDVDPAAEAGKGWNVIAVEGGKDVGSSVYLIEYVVIKKGEKVPPL